MRLDRDEFGRLYNSFHQAPVQPAAPPAAPPAQPAPSEQPSTQREGQQGSRWFQGEPQAIAQPPTASAAEPIVADPELEDLMQMLRDHDAAYPAAAAHPTVTTAVVQPTEMPGVEEQAMLEAIAQGLRVPAARTQPSRPQPAAVVTWTS